MTDFCTTYLVFPHLPTKTNKTSPIMLQNDLFQNFKTLFFLYTFFNLWILDESSVRPLERNTDVN